MTKLFAVPTQQQQTKRCHLSSPPTFQISKGFGKRSFFPDFFSDYYFIPNNQTIIWGPFNVPHTHTLEKKKKPVCIFHV
jgi:hypothetical protein